MRDTIYRQDAIDAIDSTDWYHINNKGELVHGANSKDDVPLYKAVDIYKAVNGLPPAQPERIRGKWKQHKDYPDLAYLCSECGYFTTMCSHFCPNCGAYMKVEFSDI